MVVGCRNLSRILCENIFHLRELFLKIIIIIASSVFKPENFLLQLRVRTEKSNEIKMEETKGKMKKEEIKGEQMDSIEFDWV